MSTDYAPGTSGRGLGALWLVAAALAGLVVGAVIVFAWQRPHASRLQHTAAYASRALPAARLEATLASAVIEAHDGRYELARQRSSTFFTGLRSLIPMVSGDAADAASQLLTRRDATITALARSDPASPSVLDEILTQYREMVRQAGLDSVVAPRTIAR